MKKFMTEFKEFAMKGNVIDLAVGMMIGSAFGKIVTSLVSDMLMPLISAIFGASQFSDLKVLLVDKGGESNVYLNYGSFIQTIVDFIIIALCIFMFVKFMNKLHKKEEVPAAPAEPSDEVKALNEIVSILKEKK